MSTKLKIQKIRAEVEAHEERGWLRGYEDGLAKREEQIVDLQSALEVRNETIREMREAMKKRNETSSAPTTAREALALAWELAHEVKEGQVIPAGTWVIARQGDGFTVGKNDYFDVTANGWDAENRRTLDPLPEPEPEPDWLDAPAVLAWSRWDDVRREKVWSKADECYKSTDGETIDWSNLRDVTPLYPKEDA